MKLPRSSSQTMAKRYEPTPRFGHVSAQVGNRVIVYSGRTQDRSEQSQQRLASAVEIFDTHTELWETEQTTGELPVPGLLRAASASLNEDLFIYGGLDGNGHEVDSLHRLDTKTYHWYKLSPRNAKEESPMAKYSTGMVACGDYLALFAGHGLPHGPTQPGSSLVKDIRYFDGSGWTNEFHTYHLVEGTHTWLEFAVYAC